MHSSHAPYGASALLALIPTASMFAQPYTFTRVADNTVQVPGAPTGDTFKLIAGPARSGDRVAFRATSGLGADRVGLYEWNNGMLGVVADYSTAIPQGSGLFTSVNFPSVSGEAIAFSGGNQSVSGVYQRRNGQLSRIADRSMTAPNGGMFSGLNYPSAEGSAVAFAGQHTVAQVQQPAVYRWDNGTITTVADMSSAVPGGTGNFQTLESGSIRLSAGAVSFRGTDAASKSGIYRRDTNGLAVLADSNTDAPGNLGKFTYFDDFGIDNTNLLALATTQVGGSTQSLFTRMNGTWTKLLNIGDAAPGGGTFESVSALTLEGSTIVFAGQFGAGGGSIYTNHGGTLHRIIGPGDTLDGKSVQSIGFSPEGRDGDRLAFSVTFSPNHQPPFSYDQAVYITTLPTPPGVFVPFVGAALWAANRRR